MIVPCSCPLVYLANVASLHFPRGYCCGVKSPVMASSSLELSMTPPTQFPSFTLEMTAILFAQDSSASFPIPFRPMNGRPPGDVVFPSLLFEYPIFKNLP